MASPPPEPERPCRRRASMRFFRCSSVGATHSCHPTGGFHRCMCSRSSTPHQRQPLGAGIRRSDPSVDIATPSPDHILPVTTDITPWPDRPAGTRNRDGRADAESQLSGKSPMVAIAGSSDWSSGREPCISWRANQRSRCLPAVAMSIGRVPDAVPGGGLPHRLRQPHRAGRAAADVIDHPTSSKRRR